MSETMINLETVDYQILTAELRRRGYAVQVWQEEDIRAGLEDAEVAEKFHDQIVEHMMSEGVLSAYEDVDSTDWYLMYDLIHTAMDELGILQF